MTRNELKRARNDLKQPTKSKKQPEMTKVSNLQLARNNLKRPTTSKKRPAPPELAYNEHRTLLQHIFHPNILLQSFEHCFMKNDGQNSAPNIYILCVFILGYRISRITCKPL